MANNVFSGLINNGPLPDPNKLKVPDGLGNLLSEYVESITSMFKELETAITAYEAGENREENIASVRRTLHKIKGESGMVGIEEIYEFCHEAETAEKQLHDDEHVKVLLRIKDWLNAAFQKITGGAADASHKYVTDDSTDTGYKPPEPKKVKDGSGPKILIVEDDFACRRLLSVFLSELGDCYVAVNGQEAIEAFENALDKCRPFDLICLDVMMPEKNGHEVLESIRKMEDAKGIGGLDSTKVIMTTTLNDSENIFGAFRTGCEAYLIKPIKREKLYQEIEKLGVIKLSESRC